MDAHDVLQIRAAIGFAGLDDPPAAVEADRVAALAQQHADALAHQAAPTLDPAAVRTAKGIAAAVESYSDHATRHPARLDAARELARRAGVHAVTVWARELERLRPDMAEGFDRIAAEFTEVCAALDPDPDNLPQRVGRPESDPVHRLHDLGAALTVLSSARDVFAGRATQMGGRASDAAEINSRCLAWPSRRMWSDPPRPIARVGQGTGSRGIDYWVIALQLGCTIRWQELPQQVAAWEALPDSARARLRDDDGPRVSLSDPGGG